EGSASRTEASSIGAPSRSWISAVCTIAATSTPIVSVRMATLHLLAGIVAAGPAGFGCLGRLAVDDASRWARLATIGLARLRRQGIVDGFPQLGVAPWIEVALHRRERRKVLRQHPPLAASLRDVEDGVHHRTHLRRAR